MSCRDQKENLKENIIKYILNFQNNPFEYDVD